MRTCLTIIEYVEALRPKFGLIETYHTTDGPRTRVIGGRFDTIEAARGDMNRRYAGVSSSVVADTFGDLLKGNEDEGS